MNHEFQDELCRKLPVEPPKGLVEWWLDTHDTDKANALVYRADYYANPLTGDKEKVVKCTCTACEETYYMPYTGYSGCSHGLPPAPFGYISDNGESIWSGQAALCSLCCAEVNVFHIGKFGSGKICLSRGFPLSIAVIDNIPVFFIWMIEKNVYKEGNAEIKIQPYEAYAFSGKKCYKFTGFYKYFSTVTFLDDWEPRYKCDDTSGSWSRANIFPFDFSNFIGTVLENAKIGPFLAHSYEEKCYLVSYLRTFLLHPQIENLVVQKHSKLINEFIYANSNVYYGWAQGKTITKGINWKEKRPAAMLGLNKSEYKIFKQRKWNIDDLEVFRAAKKSKYPIPAVKLKTVHKYFDTYDCKRIIEKGYDINKIYSYLSNQRKKYPNEGIALYHLLDYWDMAPTLEIPLETNKDYYPQNIRVAHDRCVELQNAKKEADFAKKERKQRDAFKKLREEYSDFYFETDGFCVFIAPEPASLRSEGRSLNHCVGRYVDTHAKGNNCIFFIRHTDSPDVSFYTVTLNTNSLKITTNLGKNNCAATPEVKAFAEKWLEYIKEIRRKQDEQGNKNNRSRECA